MDDLLPDRPAIVLAFRDSQLPLHDGFQRLRRLVVQQ